MAAYTYHDILEALKAVKLSEGDDVFVHSNIGFFGKLEGANSADDLCKAFVEAFMDIIGKTGTLVLPTFTYSFCHDEVYDPATTPTKCGMLPEYLRRHPQARRSNDPNFSVVAIGARAEEYTRDWAHEAFGQGCFWEHFLRNEGRIVCMNFDCGSTFVHYVERMNNVPYRYNKAFNGIMCLNGKERRDYAVHYVYDNAQPQDAPDFSRLDEIVRKQTFFSQIKLGKGSILQFPAKEYAEVISAALKEDPFFLTHRKVHEK